MKTVEIRVSLKEGILDPQGRTVQQALQNLGISEIEDVRIGKLITLTYQDGVTDDEAQQRSKEACQKLLANPVIESFQIKVVEETFEL